MAGIGNLDNLHGFGIGYFKEVNRLRLKLNELALRKLRPGDSYRIAFIKPQRLHHPVRKVHAALFGDKLEYARMRGRRGILGIAQLEHPRRFQIQARQARKRRGRHDY